MNMTQSDASARRHRIVVVGGGIAGVGAAVMLQNAGYGVGDMVVFERAERTGGVWHHNTYPGAACDVAAITGMSATTATTQSYGRGHGATTLNAPPCLSPMPTPSSALARTRSRCEHGVRLHC